MSDHFSGPRALAGPAGDITDLYAFPSPERPGHLVLVLNVLPQAPPDAAFSEAIDCRFRLRPVTIAGSGAATAFPFAGEDQELMFTCHFEAPRPDGDGAAPVQDGWCVAPSGEQIRFRVDDEDGGRGDGVRVYAGLRSDPFFIDLPAVVRVAQDRAARLQGGRDPHLDGVQRPEHRHRDRHPAVADQRPRAIVRGGRRDGGRRQAADPHRALRPPRDQERDILAQKEFDPVNRDLEIRDLYNLEDAFHLSKDYGGAYRARLNANLAVWDRLDGKTDWPLGPDGAHPLTELLLADYMVVDVSRPYSDDGLLRDRAGDAARGAPTRPAAAAR